MPAQAAWQTSEHPDATRGACPGRAGASGHSGQPCFPWQRPDVTPDPSRTGARANTTSLAHTRTGFAGVQRRKLEANEANDSKRLRSD